MVAQPHFIARLLQHGILVNAFCSFFRLAPKMTLEPTWTFLALTCQLKTQFGTKICTSKREGKTRADRKSKSVICLQFVLFFGTKKVLTKQKIVSVVQSRFIHGGRVLVQVCCSWEKQQPVEVLCFLHQISSEQLLRKEISWQAACT